MVSNNEGPTSTYNRFHDPSETNEGILELRRLHDEMDQAVLAAYGWSDALPPASGSTPNTSPCGFGIDYLDLEVDALLPPDLQERIASGDLFFPTATEACNFQARLLALNAERYAEEQAMGLQGTGGKKAGATGTATGKRRGRPPKAGQESGTEGQLSEQMGLGL
jgi:hypothetical protein